MDELYLVIEPFLGQQVEAGIPDIPANPAMAQEVPPQDPAPQVLPSAAELQREREELFSYLQVTLQEQINVLYRREGSFFGSLQTIENSERNADIANQILAEDLEITNQTDIKELREWLEKFQAKPSFANTFIRPFIPKK